MEGGAVDPSEAKESGSLRHPPGSLRPHFPGPEFFVPVDTRWSAGNL